MFVRRFILRSTRLTLEEYSMDKMRTLQKSLLALCLFASAMASPTPKPTESLEALQIVSQGAQLFSTNMIKIVAKEQQDNLIASPLSANIALTMAANGAAGTTEEQFRHVLHLPSKTQTLTGFQQLINTMNNVENVTLNLANKLFIGKDFPVKSQYKQDLQTYFHSDIESVDFSQSAKAADTINTWSKEKTNNRIDNIVQADDLDSSLALVLANAVYFKGNWAHQFDPKATTDRPFHVDANNVKQVPTMFRKGNYKYVELPEHEAKCIELPYANKEVSMVIILPDKIDGLAALIDNIDAVMLDCNVRLAQTYEREVRVYLPKFKTESKLDLGNTLSTKMGLSEPFSNSANFNGISDLPLKIDKVVQKAFIEVNEEGSEAAAVTGIVAIALSLDYSIEIPIDHPFYYSIVKLNQNQESGSQRVVLFSGIIAKPEI
ncbi:serine protease inhibitor 3/4-like isoform X5 [Cataglyphis hispanica]|uniref:serine protease inhibitor 3/4-like isoform X5 n=1 Tax=Cataglyphis hispanica TaxID=1086592 RepID=UPI00217F83E3|nr:serine protease inhibitor 3/4-like isoform X5 [Cataglyphis hispanica]